MILNSQPKQLRLQDDGQIFWQENPTNPMPGVAVARVKKGTGLLAPAVELLDGALPTAEDREAVIAFIQAWVIQHIATVLEKLVGLVNPEGIDGAAKEIAQKVYDAVGILPRGDVETQIAALDPEARKVLRARHIRLGPVLIFVPDLNKPAAVRLRALLWWLWNDRTLPAPVPKDGVVSVVVDEAAVDPVYQRAIGYPVYGGRAIRCDMLDRLICAVYDNAKDGTFKATHTMAEWLGSPIPDLYRVLEAMGHKKIADPADQPKPEAESSPEEATSAATPEAAVEVPAVEGETAVAAQDAAPAAPAPAPRPELATFKLKRGKASESASEGRHSRGPRPVKTPPPFEKLTEEEIAALRERDKAREEARQRKAEQRDSKPHKHKKPHREEKKVFVMEAKPDKVGESPFAMLQQLKVGKKD